MIINRRDFLAGSASALAFAGCASVSEIADMEQGVSAFIPSPTQSPTLPSISLSSLAKSKGLQFGTAIGSDPFQDADYMSIIEAECDTLVAENEHKLYSILGAPGPYQLSRGDELVTWGEANGMDFRGHVLLWNRGLWTIGEDTFPAKAGELMYARSWDYHGIRNTGTEPMKFII